MWSTIEKIRSEVNKTKLEIENSNELSPEQKMYKAKELESTISKIKKDLDSLRSNTQEADLIEEIDDLQADFESLNSNFEIKFQEELADLQEEVVENGEEEPEIVPSENDKPNRWQRNKKTVLIWAGTLWVGLLIRRWIKKRKERKEWWSSEKKWFRNRWIWKVLKWTWIWVAWFFGIKWLLDKFSNTVDKTDTSVDQVSDYEELSEENRLKYEKFWESTNSFYDNIWQKESELWYVDSNYLWKISEDVKLKEWETPERLAWVVPFCIDKDSKNISKFLWESDLNKYLFSKNYKELKNTIKSWSKPKLEKFLWPFATKLQSFQVFGTWSLWERIQDWLSGDEEERQKELNFFFRQYTKVLTYTNDRKTSIEYKIAEKAIKARWYDGDSRPDNKEEQMEIIQNALGDKERFEKEIKNNPTYSSFMSSNLLWVWDILQSNWLLNWDMSILLQEEIIWPLDEENDDILKYDEDSKKTIIDIWIEEIDSWLNNRTKKDLLDTCDDLRDDMIDESWTGFLQENIERISYACNMDDSNKATFLKETWLDKFADKYTDTLREFREKIENGTATREDLENLKKMSSEYLAFKKELNLAIYTLTQIREDNPDIVWRIINTIKKMFEWLAKSFSDIFKWDWTIWDWINIGVTISVIGWTVYIIKNPRKAIWKVLSWTWRWVTRVAWRPTLSYYWFKNKLKSLDGLADKKSYFKHHLFNWKIRNKDRILKLARSEFGTEVDNIEELLKEFDVPEKYVDQVWNYRWNKKLRKLFMSQKISDNVSIRQKLLNKNLSKKYIFHESVLKKIKSVDEISEANPKYSKSINRLLKNMKTVDDLDKLEMLITDQRFLNKIENLNKFKLKKISRSIGNADFTVEWIDDLLRSTSENLEHLDPTLKAKFDKVINTEIELIRNNPKIIWREPKIKKLTELKIEKNLTDTDLNMFIKLSDSDVRAQHFPDIGDWLKNDELSGSLKEALSEWNYHNFRKIIKNNKNLLKNSDSVINNFDEALGFARNSRYMKNIDLLKYVWKIAKFF